MGCRVMYDRPVLVAVLNALSLSNAFARYCLKNDVAAGGRVYICICPEFPGLSGPKQTNDNLQINNTQEYSIHNIM